MLSDGSRCESHQRLPQTAACIWGFRCSPFVVRGQRVAHKGWYLVHELICPPRVQDAGETAHIAGASLPALLAHLQGRCKEPHSTESSTAAQ